MNWPSLVALRASGGSATISEHLEKLIELNQVGEKVAAVPHGDTGRTELAYRLAWSRTGLKRAGFNQNSSRGIWSVTEAGESANEQTVRAAISTIRQADIQKYKGSKESEPAASNTESGDWKDSLLTTIKKMSPEAFERLSQRLLRESGFTQVKVTGKSGDGGIDGTGILQLSLMSFPVLFQCKIYQGSVGSGAVRDFRGAMTGRTDKGLLIATGNFSADARKEATRDGAPPIELIDGDELCDHLKKLGLGVTVELIESVSVQSEWFEQI
ncbi:MAG: restriction endonuclease [Sphingomonas bacterium]|nr:restriction endonuclease [Sphingomonas bacterium]